MPGGFHASTQDAGRGWWNRSRNTHQRNGKLEKKSPLRRRLREPLNVEYDSMQLIQAQCAEKFGDLKRRPSSRLQDWLATNPFKDETLPDIDTSFDFQDSPTNSVNTQKLMEAPSNHKDPSPKILTMAEEEETSSVTKPKMFLSFGKVASEDEGRIERFKKTESSRQMMFKKQMTEIDLDDPMIDNEDHDEPMVDESEPVRKIEKKESDDTQKQGVSKSVSLRANLRAKLADRAPMLPGEKKYNQLKKAVSSHEKSAKGCFGDEGFLLVTEDEEAEQDVPIGDADADPDAEIYTEVGTGSKHRKSSTSKITLPQLETISKAVNCKKHTQAPAKVGPNAKYWEWLLRASSLLAYGEEKKRGSGSYSPNANGSGSSNENGSPDEKHVAFADAQVTSVEEDNWETGSNCSGKTANLWNKAKRVPRLLALTRVTLSKPPEDEPKEEGEEGNSEKKEKVPKAKKRLATVNFQLTLLRQEAQERAIEEEEKKRAQEDEQEEEKMDPNRRKSTLADFENKNGRSAIVNLANDLNVPVDDVHTAKKFFDQFDVEQTGFLEKDQFKLLVASLAGQESADDIEEAAFDTSWAEADKDGNECIDFVEFTTWYSSNGFLEDLLLSPAQRHIREVARRFEIPFNEVEHVKTIFDRTDDDGSGLLEFNEFKVLLYKLMKIPAHLEMPQSRVKQFWQEIDADGSGNVDFEEFLQWYMRYFDLAGGGQLVSPIEHFYKSVRSLLPDHARKSIMPGGSTSMRDFARADSAGGSSRMPKSFQGQRTL